MRREQDARPGRRRGLLWASQCLPNNPVPKFTLNIETRVHFLDCCLFLRKDPLCLAEVGQYAKSREPRERTETFGNSR